MTAFKGNCLAKQVPTSSSIVTIDEWKYVYMTNILTESSQELAAGVFVTSGIAPFGLVFQQIFLKKSKVIHRFDNPTAGK